MFKFTCFLLWKKVYIELNTLHTLKIIVWAIIFFLYYNKLQLFILKKFVMRINLKAIATFICYYKWIDVTTFIVRCYLKYYYNYYWIFCSYGQLCIYYPFILFHFLFHFLFFLCIFGYLLKNILKLLISLFQKTA